MQTNCRQVSLIWVLVLLAVQYGYAQRTEIGVNVSPSISYRTTQINQDPVAQAIQNGEKGIYTFDFGLDLRRRLSQRLKVGVGVWYSQKGFSNTNVGITYNDPRLLGKVAQIDFIQNYIEIPIAGYYKFNKGDLSDIYGLVGFNSSFLFSQKNNVITRAGEINKSEFAELEKPYLQNSTAYNPGFLIGFGLQRSIDEKFSIGLEPAFKMMLSPLKESRFMTHRKLYSLALNFRFVRNL